MMLHTLSANRKERTKQLQSSGGAAGSGSGTPHAPYTLGNYYSYDDEFDYFDEPEDQEKLDRTGFNSNHIYDSDRTYGNVVTSSSFNMTPVKTAQPPDKPTEQRQRRPSTAGGGREDHQQISNDPPLDVKTFSTPQTDRKLHKLKKRLSNKLITAKLINTNTDSPLPQHNQAQSSSSNTSQTGKSRPTTAGRNTVKQESVTTAPSRPKSGKVRPFSGKSQDVSGDAIHYPIENLSRTSSVSARPKSGKSRPTSGKLQGISGDSTSYPIQNGSREHFNNSRPPTGSTRPKSGKTRPTSGKSQGDSANVRQNASRQTSGSARPKSGVSRPLSAVSRKSIASAKDTLLSKHGGSAQENTLYGKAEDEELERFMTPVRPPSGKPKSASAANSETTINKNDDTHSTNSASRSESIERLPPISRNSDSATGDRPSSGKSINSLQQTDEVLTQRPTTTDTFGDDSDEELKRLAQEIDDGIYDPLASLQKLPRQTPSSTSTQQKSPQTSPSKAETQSVNQKEEDDETTGINDNIDPSNGGHDVTEETKPDTIPPPDDEETNGENKDENNTVEQPKDDEPSVNNDGDVVQNRDKGGDGEKGGDVEKGVDGGAATAVSENLAIDIGDDGATTIMGDDESEASTTIAQEVEDLYLKKPKWHPPWQLRQEIVAHEGAIPELVVDPTNRWFATGSQDKTIRLWDIQTGRQKLVIKAHKREVRALAFGPSGHRMLFSAGDDRQLLCHDVEVNRVVSRFTGQSSVIYDMAFYHPENLLITCGRDKLLKVFDIRTQKIVRSMRGHTNTVSCVETDPFNKLVISGSHDATVRLWAIGDGRCISTLYGHNKSVRALCVAPDNKKFLSSSSEKIIAWDLPDGDTVQEIPAQNLAINSITINQNGVVVAGGANGYMSLWDYDSAFRFQRISRARVYESHEQPICVFATKFDKSGKKLICSDACNVVKIYSEAYHKKNQTKDVSTNKSVINNQTPSISTIMR